MILNTRGERIVVYPDGSWRYYAQSDSVLIGRQLLKEDILLPDAEPRPEGISRTSHPVADSDITALARRFAQRTSSDVREAHHTLTRLMNEKFATEAKLGQAQKNKKLIEPDLIATLEDQYTSLTRAVKDANKRLKWIEKMDGKAQGVLVMPVEKKSKALNKLIVAYDAQQPQPSHDRQTQVVVSPRTSATPAPRTSEMPAKTSVNLKAPIENIAPTLGSRQAYTRAETPCNVQQHRGERNTMMVQKAVLFRHTDEELRSYFGTQDLVTCYASLLQIENNLYLSLDFVIASPDARKNFGILENKSMMRLRFLDGTFLTLFNTRVDHGRIDAYTGNTIFTGSYLIDKSAEKQLSRFELDMVRVMWSAGFEDYDVSQLDFFIHQFNCLKG